MTSFDLNDLKRLEKLETIDSAQFQFLWPFRWLPLAYQTLCKLLIFCGFPFWKSLILRDGSFWHNADIITIYYDCVVEGTLVVKCKDGINQRCVAVYFVSVIFQ